MITNISKGDLEEAAKGNHDLGNMMSLLGDKLRVIYIALGWSHMLSEFEDADRIVEELTQGVLEELAGGDVETSTLASAGLSVSGYWDGDVVALDYSFML